MQGNSDPMVQSAPRAAVMRPANEVQKSADAPSGVRAADPTYVVRWTPAGGGPARLHVDDVEKALSEVTAARALRIAEQYAAQGAVAEVLEVRVLSVLGFAAA